MGDLMLTHGRLKISVLSDVVTIAIHCGDEYEAQSAYDEAIAYLQRGEGLTLHFGQPCIAQETDTL